MSLICWILFILEMYSLLSFGEFYVGVIDHGICIDGDICLFSAVTIEMLLYTQAGCCLGEM
jgi:hypothetical protein